MENSCQLYLSIAAATSGLADSQMGCGAGIIEFRKVVELECDADNAAGNDKSRKTQANIETSGTDREQGQRK
jgi:hypothetical protein